MRDTQRFVEKLRAVGISGEQAKTFSEVFQDVTSDGEIATKRDIERLEAGTKCDIERLEAGTNLSAERIEAKMDRLDAKIDHQEVRLSGDSTTSSSG
jgi:hypothetical protein